MTEAQSIRFTVPGEPVPWDVFRGADNNPRSKKYERKVRLNAYQDTIRIAAKQAMRGLDPHDGPVDLEVWFYRQIPASAPKREAARQRWVDKHILKRPDRTNLLKGAEDALNGIVYLDDSQVLDGEPHKRYDEEPRTEFLVKFL